MGKLINRAIKQANSAGETAAARMVDVLTQTAQEAAQPYYLSTDPTSGYDAARIAVRLFESGRLEEFSEYMKEKDLTPNIILANGLTLLQNSLFRFPQDAARVECLLGLGANPNLFLRKIDEEAFGSKMLPATYHPLNYAFANCPKLTSQEICIILRKFGASAEGLKSYLEADPIPAEEGVAKAEFRRTLINLRPDPELTKLVRRDVDMSVMQKHLANLETQLSAAGLQVVSYVPRPVEKEAFAIDPVLTSGQTGKMIVGKGLFLGTWEPSDRDGLTLGKKYHVYVAPADMSGKNDRRSSLSYEGVLRKMATLKNWQGHDGIYFEDDEAFYNILKSKHYSGQWFIPTLDILKGLDLKGKMVFSENIFNNRNAGDFRGTFVLRNNGSSSSHHYWSCTKGTGKEDIMATVNFADGSVDRETNKYNRLSCRLVRAELIP